MKSLLLLTIITQITSSIIGIDFGSDWTKISYVKQGVPLDLVLNKESKRKTGSALTLHKGNRIYGGSIKHPKSTFPELKNLLGTNYSDGRAESYRKKYDNSMKLGTGNRIVFHADGEKYSVEHLAGLVIGGAVKQAEAYGQESRQALVDAASLTTRVITIMNDVTAVALNYAMLRQFSNASLHIFYDMGAGSTVASLVEFKGAKGKGKKSVPQIQVLETGHDQQLGGAVFDDIIYSLLLAKFLKAHSISEKDFSSDPVAVGRLLKEANRVKQVLSANTETYASVESLFNSLDFKVLIKRAEFEEAAQGIADRVVEPINHVLHSSGLNIASIESVVLVGGGVRVPLVLSALTALVGEGKIARNVNGDEAAVMGAGFRAASLSTLFRVREIQVKDRGVHDAEVWYDLNDKTVKTLIFGKKTAVGSKKIMSFKKQTDFEFQLAYKDGLPIFSVNVSGVEAAWKNVTDSDRKIVKGPLVKATLIYDDSGLYSVGNAFLWAETLPAAAAGGGIADSIKSFFGGSKPETTEAKEVESGGEEKNETLKVGKKNDTTPRVEQIPLTVSVAPLSFAPLTDEEKHEIKARIHAMDARDAEQRAQEESLNNLESLIYSIKYALDEDDVVAVSTEAEREQISTSVVTAQEWLEDNYNAKTAEFNAQRSLLEKSWANVSLRRKEASTRPLAVEKLRQYISSVRVLVNETLVNQTKAAATQKVYLEIPVAEFGVVTKYLDEAEFWLDGVVKEQQAKSAVETPAFLTKDCTAKEKWVKDKWDAFVKLKKWKYVEEKKDKKKEKKGDKPEDEAADEADDSKPDETADGETADETKSSEPAEETKSEEADEPEDGKASEETTEQEVEEPTEVPVVERDEL